MTNAQQQNKDHIKAARKFLKAQRGLGIWIAYGTADAEITGYVLTVSKDVATVQDKETGALHEIPLWAITEMVEA